MSSSSSSSSSSASSSPSSSSRSWNRIVWSRLGWYGPASLAGLIYNWHGDRSYIEHEMDNDPPGRRPGFTEVWGCRLEESRNSSDTNKSKTLVSWGVVDTSVTDFVPLALVPLPEQQQSQNSTRTTANSTTSSTTMVIVLQHRPAWAVQAALRSCHIAHVVVNIPHAVVEWTGPLPCLVEWTASSTSKSSSCRVVVGGSQQRIVDHVFERYSPKETTDNHDDDDEWMVQQSLSSVLKPSFQALHYADPVAWYGWHALQARAAYQGHYHGGSNGWSLSGRLATWWERSVALAQLHHVSMIHETEDWIATQLAHVQEHYHFVARYLQRQKNHKKKKSAKIQLLLWDHLMQARTNVHLVTLLTPDQQQGDPTTNNNNNNNTTNSNRVLLEFVESVWRELGFGDITTTTEPTTTTTTRTMSTWYHNNWVNAHNVYCQAPPTATVVTNQNQQSNAWLEQALQHVAQSSVPVQSWAPLLSAAAVPSMMTPRVLVPPNTNNHNSSSSSFHPSTSSTRATTSNATSNNTSKMDPARQAQEHGDQVWMATTALVTVLALGLSTLTATTGPQSSQSSSTAGES